jgi:hypothetical protein
MRRLTTIGLALVLMLGSAVTTSATVAPLAQPAAVGSQLIFYFDTRPGFTTFANVYNTAIIPVFLRVDFWGQNFDVKTTDLLTLAAGEQRVIDVGNELKASVNPAQHQGIAVATLVDESGNAIEFPALTGNFTVANLATGSAWGAPAAARSARNAADGSAAERFSVVDGTNVVYQPIRPDRVVLAAFYDPRSLAPASAHGSQVIFVNFANNGSAGAVTTATTEWVVNGTRGDQTLLFDTVSVRGVADIDLVALLGDDANGGAGAIIFGTDKGNDGDSRLIFFAEALGTFGTGYLLPLLQ